MIGRMTQQRRTLESGRWAALVLLVVSVFPPTSPPAWADELGSVDPDIIFADGFDGLAEGEVCNPERSACRDGLLCCFFCGIPDCPHTCRAPVDGSCPLIP
jgi:hypothetical protein